MDDLYDYSGIVAEEHRPDGPIARIHDLAARQHYLEQELADAEERAGAVKKVLAAVREQDIPEAMDELGLSSIVTKGGARVDVKETLRVSVSKANMPGFVQWLEERHDDGIVKRQLVCPLGKDSAAVGAELVKLLSGQETDPQVLDLVENPLQASLESKIEPQTLKAYVGKVRDDVEMPQEVSVFDQKVASVAFPQPEAGEGEGDDDF